MTDRILLGFEVPSGEEVYVEPCHLVVTGLTQASGKTTTLKALLSRSGLRAIVFKTKPGEIGFEDIGHRIPLFFREESDWRFVLSLVEMSEQQKIRQSAFKYAFIMACRGAKSLEGVKGNVDRMLREKYRKESFLQGVFTVVCEYLDKVIPQIEKLEFSSTLELGDGVNIMDLEGLNDEMQALVLRSVMREVVKGKYQDLIVIMPEAWKFIPQGRGSPVKQPTEAFIRQGAIKRKYLWIDAQDLTGLDKMPLRQCKVWLLGNQMLDLEVERVRKQIPLPAREKPLAEEIMNLKLGHFFAVLGDKKVRKVYVLPAGVKPEAARKVAKGVASPKSVQKILESKKPKQKSKPPVPETPARPLRKLENRISVLESSFSVFGRDLRSQIEDLKTVEHSIQESSRPVLEKESSEEMKADSKDESAVELPEASTVPDEVRVVHETPALTVRRISKPLVLDTSNTLGRLAWLYSEDFFSTWQSAGEITTELEERGWGKNDVQSSLDQMCAWGFLRKRKTDRWKYRAELPVETARQNGLIKESPLVA